MADFDPDYEQITKLMEERSTGYASANTAAKELVAMTGLDFDVAKAFCSNLNTRGSTTSMVRGYKKGEWPKKKTPKKGV